MSNEEKKEEVKPKVDKKELMKSILKKQKTRRVFIPKEKGEPEGATESVILNGYRLNIKKGVYVDVPEQVADVIEEATMATAKAFEDAKEKLKKTEKMEFDNS